MITRITTTLINSGLNDPQGITYDTRGDNLLITNNHYMSKHQLTSRILSVLSGTRTRGYGDGKLFYSPRDLISLSNTLTLVADTYNNRLRLLDTQADLVTTVCRDDSDQSCRVNRPFSLLRVEYLIYVGQTGSIRTLECE